MPIILPNLSDTFCVNLVACGTIETKDRKVLSLLHGRPRSLVTNFGVEGAECWAYAGFGSSNPERLSPHFHVEIASDLDLIRDSFEGDAVEEIDQDAFQSAISPFLRKNIEVDLTGIFILPTSRIAKNSIASAMVKSHTKKNSEVKTIASAFFAEDAIIERIQCMIARDGKHAKIIMETILNGKVIPDYLVDLMMFLDVALRIHFLGERINDAAY
ncbi:hypothetical protein ACYOEI_15580 [Singulisphaera rosea]